MEVGIRMPEASPLSKTTGKEYLEQDGGLHFWEPFTFLLNLL